jgi:hypothetical protein
MPDSASELEPYFRAMYDRARDVDVGVPMLEGEWSP